MERDERIGLNIGSGLPWTAVPGIGLPMAAWMTRKAGYGFWQVLPFRSVSVAGLVRTGIPVRFAEPAWNATTFLAHLQGKSGTAGGPAKLQDPLFFSDPETCDQLFGQILQEFNATPIHHHLKMMHKGGLVEVHPGLEGTVDEWVAAAKDAGLKPFAVDLCHLRRFPVSRLAMWKTLEHLLPLASLIHVQAVSGDEWQKFISGNSTLLGGMIRFAQNQGYTGPFVVEYDPRATGPTGILPWVLADNLRRVRERIEECLAGE